MLFVDGKDGVWHILALDGQLGDQRLDESSEAQSTTVVEVKVEIGQSRTWCWSSMSDKIFNDRGTVSSKQCSFADIEILTTLLSSRFQLYQVRFMSVLSADHVLTKSKKPREGLRAMKPRLVLFTLQQPFSSGRDMLLPVSSMN